MRAFCPVLRTFCDGDTADTDTTSGCLLVAVAPWPSDKVPRCAGCQSFENSDLSACSYFCYQQKFITRLSKATLRSGSPHAVTKKGVCFVVENHATLIWDKVADLDYPFQRTLAYNLDDLNDCPHLGRIEQN